jgi:hypothetical protein
VNRVDHRHEIEDFCQDRLTFYEGDQADELGKFLPELAQPHLRVFTADEDADWVALFPEDAAALMDFLSDWLGSLA